MEFTVTLVRDPKGDYYQVTGGIPAAFETLAEAFADLAADVMDHPDIPVTIQVDIRGIEACGYAGTGRGLS